MKLHGIDISHWNKKNTVDKNATKDFIIMKATEGRTYVDSALNIHDRKCDFYGIQKGFYHFARPDLGNLAKEEAKHFCEQVNYRGRALYALDIEGEAIKMENIDEWALKWLQYVEKRKGIKPLLYISHSQLRRFPKVAENNFGLWVARYNNLENLGEVKPWKFAAIWQYTSNPIDKNYFFGNKKQLLKYMGG